MTVLEILKKAEQNPQHLIEETKHEE